MPACRHRLDHRAQLHHLRATRQRRDDGDVRVDAALPGRRALLAARRRSGVDIFYTAPTAIRAIAREGRRVGEEVLAPEPCGSSARWASRSTPRSGTGTTTSSATGVPDRRHLVADRDRRHPDHSASRERRRSKPGIGDPAPSSASEPVLMGRQRGLEESSKATGVSGNLCIKRSVAGSGPNDLRRSHERFVGDLLLDLPRIYYFTGDGCRRDDRRLLLDHRPGRRRAERLGASPRHGRGRERARRARGRCRGRRRRLPARDQGHRDLRLRASSHRTSRTRRTRRARSRHAPARNRCAKRDRPDRQAGRDPDRTGITQDPLRQDHAADPAQGRGARFRRLRRHLDPRGPEASSNSSSAPAVSESTCRRGSKRYHSRKSRGNRVATSSEVKADRRTLHDPPDSLAGVDS